MKVTDVDREKCAALGHDIHMAIRESVTRHQPVHPADIMSALVAACTMVVAYDSMQAFLDNLAVSADAKEHIRAIHAGEVAEVN